MWWKIYFFLIVLLLLAGSFGILQYSPLTFADIISILLEITTVVGLYTYIYKKNMGTSRFWQIIFILYATVTFITLIDIYALPKNFIEQSLPFLKSNVPQEDSTVLFTIFLYLPIQYALFQLGFKKKK